LGFQLTRADNSPIHEQADIDLPVGEGLLDVLPAEFLCLFDLRMTVGRGVSLALVFEAIDDERSFFSGQERSGFREVMEDEVRRNSDEDCEDSFLQTELVFVCLNLGGKDLQG
jgi:hypothetical protein